MIVASSSFSDNPCKVVRIPSVPSIHLAVALIVSNWFCVSLPLVITNFCAALSRVLNNSIPFNEVSVLLNNFIRDSRLPRSFRCHLLFSNCYLLNKLL
nr:MAG TPA: hypothetical protein [Caudoviricetes sp.]